MSEMNIENMTSVAAPPMTNESIETKMKTMNIEIWINFSFGYQSAVRTRGM